jgi:hypothetical protein
MAIVEEAYEPSRIVMPEKEEEYFFFVNVCYPTNTEMEILCNCIFL